jgi:hypothetical protein
MDMKTEIKFAILYVVASFLWSCIEYFTGLESTHINLHPYFVTPFYVLLTAVIYILALREKRAILGGKVTFGKAFATGIILSVFILVLNPVSFYLFNTFINPGFFKDFALYKIQTENMTRAAADAYYNFNNLLIRGSLYRLVMGIVATILISSFIKKNVTKELRHSEQS